MSDEHDGNQNQAAPNDAPADETPPSNDADTESSSTEQPQSERAVDGARSDSGKQTPQNKNGWPRRVVARYGMLGTLGEFTCSKKITVEPGCMLVLQTDRGIEIGAHVPLGGSDRGCACIEATLDEGAAKAYLDNSGQEYLQRRAGRVLRAANEQDLDEERHINAASSEEFDLCNELIRKHNLPMKLITCEHLFGGERIIFYFMAEGRVDFRQLVRDLAKEYQTRIEMRQVGARDEARLVADYEICGRQCCCKNFLKILRPVNMKMAKMQKATLDPSKVSGRCGRLRCCLRYEHEVYDELQRRLPRSNKWVRTPDGEGKIVDRQIITQLVTVELENRRRVAYPVEEIEVLEGGPSRPQAEKQRPATGQNGADQPDQQEGRPKRRRSKRPPPKSRDESTPAPPAETTQPEKTPEQSPPAEQIAEPAAAEKTPPPAQDDKGSQDAAASNQQKGEGKSGKKRRRRRRRRPKKKSGDQSGQGGD